MTVNPASADFNIQITVRNARLLRAVRGKFGTGAEMARAVGISRSSVSALMTMREAPITVDGEWRDIAMAVAGALGMDPDGLWPEYMRERTMKRATAELELTADQVNSLIAPLEDPADTIERQDTVVRLLACLSERQRGVVEGLIGGATLEELGREQGVGRERIRQIDLKAKRVMRAQAARLGLLPSGRSRR